MNLNAVMMLLEARKRQAMREQQAQELSRGNGYQGQATLAELMNDSPKYGTYMGQLGQNDFQNQKDQEIFQKTEQTMGEPMPPWFMERFWLNQSRDQRLNDMFRKYRGGL